MPRPAPMIARPAPMQAPAIATPGMVVPVVAVVVGAAVSAAREVAGTANISRFMTANARKNFRISRLQYFDAGLRPDWRTPRIPGPRGATHPSDCDPDRPVRSSISAGRQVPCVRRRGSASANPLKFPRSVSRLSGAIPRWQSDAEKRQDNLRLVGQTHPAHDELCDSA